MSTAGAARRQQVFVAREAQINLLNGLLQQALDGRGQIIFVSGKGGAGKTWLLERFLAGVREAHPEILACYSQCGLTPLAGDLFRPFDDLLSEVEQEVCNRSRLLKWRKRLQERYKTLAGGPKTEWGGLLGEVLGELLTGPLIPLIKIALAILDAITGSKEKEASNENLFRHRLDRLESYAQRWPLALALDNFHRADDKTCALLEDVAIRAKGLRILLVIALRPEDLSLDSPIYGLWSDMTTRRGIQEINLDQLTETEDEQHRFVHAYLEAAYHPNRFDESFRLHIARRTESLPLFVSELLKFYEEQGWICCTDGAWIQSVQPGHQLPGTLERFIKQERWARLTTEDQKRLQVASVEGEEFTLQVVADAIEECADQVCERFDSELGSQRKWVRPTGSIQLGYHTYPRYGFWHSFYWEVAYGSLSPAAKMRWHGQVGMALRAILGETWTNKATELARHFEWADNWKEALACYDYIWREQQGIASERQLAQIALKRAEILRKLNRRDEALRCYQDAAKFADAGQEIDLTTQQRAALIGQAWTLFEMEDFPQAEPLFSTIIGLDAKDSIKTERRLYLGRCVSLLAIGRQDDALAALDQALKPDDPEANDRLDPVDLRDTRRWLQELREKQPDRPGILEALQLIHSALEEITC